MRFKANDWLVHPQHGVGRVVKRVIKKSGQGSSQEYYEIAITSGTVWVPVEGSPSRLRRITPKSDLGRYRALLRSRPTPLATDYKQRQTTLSERLKESTFESKCEVLRDLMAFRWKKPLNEYGRNMLRDVRQLLYTEWAAAEGLSVTEAAHEVDALLLEGKETYRTTAG